MLDRYPDLVGIYSVGGGNRGVVQALKDRGSAQQPTLIGHNLTATTQEFLIEGSMDAVIHQDMNVAADITVSALIALSEGAAYEVKRVPIDLITKENMLDRACTEAGSAPATSSWIV